MIHEHECKPAGCQFRPKQKPSYHPKNEAVRAAQAAMKAWHKEHGIEHNRSGCK